MRVLMWMRKHAYLTYCLVVLVGNLLWWFKWLSLAMAFYTIKYWRKFTTPIWLSSSDIEVVTTKSKSFNPRELSDTY